MVWDKSRPAYLFMQSMVPGLVLTALMWRAR